MTPRRTILKGVLGIAAVAGLGRAAAAQGSLPDQAMLLAFNLVCARGTHVVIGADHCDHWAEILATLRARPFTTLPAGHATGIDRAQPGWADFSGLPLYKVIAP